jgi:hypothetical protein
VNEKPDPAFPGNEPIVNVMDMMNLVVDMSGTKGKFRICKSKVDKPFFQVIFLNKIFSI